jgi:GGDEF domain-containing protein
MSHALARAASSNVSEGARIRPRLASARRTSSDRGEGRWSLCNETARDAETMAFAWAQVLLDRHGVLSRETVALEAWARYLGWRDYMRRRPQHLWQVATTTKSHIAEEANPQMGQTVLVFHIVNFRQQELELGIRSANALVQQIVQRMRVTLDSSGAVAAERSGTIVALAPIGREEAEHVAMQLITSVETTPFRVNGHREGVAIKLGCGIISFLQTGGALALSIPAVEGIASL